MSTRKRKVATRPRKRKLPKDLAEASDMAKACISASKRVSDACNVLRNTSLSDLQGSMATEDVAIYLIAKYGLKEMSKICKVVSGLPSSRTASQKNHYIRQLSGREDADVIAAFTKANCNDFFGVFPQASPSVLAPPTSTCFDCNRPLNSNHDCEVSLHKSYKCYIRSRSSIINTLTTNHIEEVVTASEN